MNTKKIFKIVLFIIAVLLCHGTISKSATIAVPGDYATIQAAINASVAGDTIDVAAGDYTETLLISKRIILTGAGFESTTIDNEDDTPVISIDITGVTLSGFKIVETGSIAGNSAINVADTSGNNSEPIVIQNNLLDGEGTGHTGININGTTDTMNVTVQQNIFKGFTEWGITGNSDAAISINNNTFDDASDWCAVGCNGNDVTITAKNNIVFNQPICGFQEAMGTFTGNYNNYFNTLVDSGIAGDNYLSCNPAFEQTTDQTLATFYKPKQYSAMIDNGDPTSALDSDGTAADIGAIAFDQSGGNDKITNLYVDNTSGTDDTDTPTEADPWQTIAQALTYAGNGHTIYLMPGTFSIATKITLQNYGFTLKGYDRGISTIASSVDDDSAIEITGNNVTISNLTITGSSIPEDTAMIFIKNNATISHNTITGNSATNMKIIEGNSADRVITGINITNNIIADSGWRGVFFNGDPNAITATVTNNTIYNNSTGSGIHADALVTLTATNNIIANNQVGVECDSCTSFTSTYNNFYNNTANDYEGDVSAGTGDTSVDPLFVDATNGDFHLKSEAGSYTGSAWTADTVTSLCIDAGDPDSAYSAEPSPNGSRINMGAYGHTNQASKSDNCPSVSNATQLDTDSDGDGNACDTDDDDDGVLDAAPDNCPLVVNADQADTDSDGTGDACVDDADGDAVLDASDNCKYVVNATQLDSDEDGAGDACDTNHDTILLFSSSSEPNIDFPDATVVVATPTSSNESGTSIIGSGACDVNKTNNIQIIFFVLLILAVITALHGLRKISQ